MIKFITEISLVLLLSHLLCIITLAKSEIELSASICKTQNSCQHIKTNESSCTSGALSSTISDTDHQDGKSKVSDTEQDEKKVINFQIYSEEQLEIVEKYLYSLDEFDGNYSLSDVENLSINFRLHALVYNDLFIHSYKSYKDLISASGSQVNQESCLDELNKLIKRTNQFKHEGHASSDLNLHMLLDTFGRPTSGTLNGFTNWIGSYKGCQKLRDTRFCYAILKHQRPLQGNIANDLSGLKSGVCLPKTCDSLNYKNKFQLIEELIEINMRQVDLGERKLSHLYCLPDEDSPLRTWWKYPKTLITVIILTLWLSAIIYSSIRFQAIEKLQKQSKLDDDQSISKQSGASFEKNPQLFIHKLYRSLSIINNINYLFKIDKVKEIKKKQDTSGKEETEQDNSLIDLGIIDGIKVISMFYVITGHVILSFTTNQQNSRDLTEVGVASLVYISSNMMPAFAVNGFFTITGILTTYYLFKSSQFQSLISDGRKWFTIIIYRYLRIMPTYVIVFAYTKYLAKFTGSGPLWDYGTSSLSHRYTCEEESWWWILLFGANLKPVLRQCIPSAWYLANDFQFFLVTPFFLTALYKNPKFGQKLIKLCVLGGVVAGFFSIFLSKGGDLRPVMRFMPHGFSTYVAFLSDSYTKPQYRIPAYLCGLLLGYALHNYEQAKLKFLEQVKKQKVEQEEENSNLYEPDWPEWLKKNGTLISFLGILSGALLPTVGIGIHVNKFFTRILLGLAMSLYHVVFSVSIGLYILIAATGDGNQVVNNLLSASFWKPLSKLSLGVVLTNLEVTNYLMQTSVQTFHLDFKSQTALNLICILFSYITATFLCILFEFPLKSTLNNVIAYATSKLTKERKKEM